MSRIENEYSECNFSGDGGKSSQVGKVKNHEILQGDQFRYWVQVEGYL